MYLNPIYLGGPIDFHVWHFVKIRCFIIFHVIVFNTKYTKIKMKYASAKTGMHLPGTDYIAPEQPEVSSIFEVIHFRDLVS